MKIKNVSQQELKITVPAGKDLLTSSVKPNQVMYCENISSITKQLVIYERKKLIVIDKSVEKPDYVNHYKPYYESGTYFSQPKTKTIDIDEVLEDQEMDEEELPIIPETDFDLAEEEGQEEMPVKKGRGRPRKPVTEKPAQTEKKKRGRPIGSTKKNR